jgi:hypothetical protein
LLDTGEKPNAIALEMLDRIQAGDLRGAKALLDWMREDVHLEGGDDPLGGPVFPRFWTKGEAPDARTDEAGRRGDSGGKQAHRGTGRADSGGCAEGRDR